MSKGYEYMRQVVVRSVGVGGVVDDNGRSLRVIGNMPIKPGDTVWTDGRIVYGHRPVRPNVKPIIGESVMFPYAGESGCGAFKESGEEVAAVDNIEPLKSQGSNWMYVDEKGTLYTYMMGTTTPSEQRIDDNDSSFYLDMRVTDDAVYTAEIDINQYPYQGVEVENWKLHDVCFEVINLLMHETGNYSPERPDFGFHWPSDGDQQVRNNTRIRVRKNGVEQESINLDRYSIVLDTFAQIYAEHDSLDTEIKKRYHWSGYDADDYSYDENVDIHVAIWTIQPLNFRFVDDNGNWEMTVCTTGQGSCAPHTIDQEYNSETDEYEDVHSWYAICISLVYYIIRVDSTGKQTILQRWISVKPYEKNLVIKHAAWRNARAMVVEPVSINERSQLNFYSDDGYITVKGDFSKILGIYDTQGNKVGDGYTSKIFSFDKLTIPNPDVVGEHYGATNKILIINLADGSSQDAVGDVSLCPFTSLSYETLTDHPRGIKIDMNIKRAYFDVNASSYLGRLTLHRLKNGGILAAIFGQLMYVYMSNEDWYGVGTYCFNFNIDKIRRKKKMKSPKTIRDLIASRTKSDEDDD